MQLSKRLQAIANLVPPCQTIADIGTDHGSLPIYLCLNHKVQQAYACDIAKKPLQQAIHKIAQFQLQKQIIPMLTDGIKNLPSHIDVIIIAGMGGHLITKILSERVDGYPQLILQANSHCEIVRQWLMQSSYEIIDEVMVYEHQQYYEIIAAKKTNKKIVYDEFSLQYGPIFIQKREKLWLEKYQKLLNQYQDIFLTLKPGQPKYDSLVKKIADIKKIVQN